MNVPRETMHEISPLPAAIEKLNYGVSCHNVDFRTLKARNQFISKVVGPLMDMILAKLEEDRREGAGTRYSVSLVVVSETDIERIQ
jgi:hypothetical protein